MPSIEAPRNVPFLAGVEIFGINEIDYFHIDEAERERPRESARVSAQSVIISLLLLTL
jgi:hypothetical protein